MTQVESSHILDELKNNSLSTNDLNHDSFDQSHEKNCNDNEDEQGHCSHQCSGDHNMAISKNEISITPTLVNKNQAAWAYYKYYQRPVLDPALRPPTFS